MLFIVSGIMFAASMIIPEKIVFLLGARGASIQHHAVVYLRLVSIGLIPNMLGWIISYGFQGVGDSKTPMLSMILATCLNLILDPVLILGWGIIPPMGIQGAAIATVIAQIAGFLFVFIRLIGKKSPIHINFAHLVHWDFSIARKILKIGMPAGIQTFILFMSVIFLLNLVADQGNSEVAAVTIVVRFLMLIGIPALALADVVTSLVGQAFGARKYIHSVLIAHTAFIGGLIATLFMAAAGLIFEKSIIGFFAGFDNPADAADVMHHGIIALRYIIIMVFLWLPVLIYGGAFKGAGDTVPPMIVGFLRLALIIILPLQVFVSDPFANVLTATLIAFGIEGISMYIWYTRRLWTGLLHNQRGK